MSNVLMTKAKLNAVLLISVLCLSTHVMLCKNCNRRLEMNLFQSDFVKPLWLRILPIILISYKKVLFQRHWFDK